MGLILVDTSVWVDHLHRPETMLSNLIAADQCVLHPFVLAEIALGNLPRWDQTVTKLRKLRSMDPLPPPDLLQAIQDLSMQGSGLGLVDAHLLAAAVSRPGMLLWSRDRRLAARAEALSLRAELS